MVPRCPPGTFPVEGLRCWSIEQDTAVGGESSVSEGRRSLSFLLPLLGCPRRAPVVAVCPPRPGGLTVSQLGWGTPLCTGPVGRVAGAHVRDRCRRALFAGGGALTGLFPHPLFGPLVGRGSPWPCVRGVRCPWQRAGRRPWEGGGGRAGRTVCCLLGVCVERCLSCSLGWRGNGGDVRPLGAGPLGPASEIGGRRCPLGGGVVGTSMASVHALVEDDPPCSGRRRAAAAPGAATVSCLLVSGVSPCIPVV